jgi:DNA invertase Pin-like site-specific DNA recombinase
MAILAYARVSTQDQDLSGQIEALTAAGATSLFKEKISGARADRPQLAKLMSALKAGDTVIVTKLDRLGRSTRELLDLIERISAAGASFKSLGDPLWDTTSSQGRSRGALQPAPDDFAMLRLILLATLPQFAGVLLMVAGRTSERRGM